MNKILSGPVSYAKVTKQLDEIENAAKRCIDGLIELFDKYSDQFEEECLNEIN